jgi:hypothetical protein
MSPPNSTDILLQSQIETGMGLVRHLPPPLAIPCKQWAHAAWDISLPTTTLCDWRSIPGNMPRILHSADLPLPVDRVVLFRFWLLHDRQDGTRRMLPTMINVLHGGVHLRLAGIVPAGVQVTVEPREITAAHFYPHATMTCVICHTSLLLAWAAAAMDSGLKTPSLERGRRLTDAHQVVANPRTSA